MKQHLGLHKVQKRMVHLLRNIWYIIIIFETNKY